MLKRRRSLAVGVGALVWLLNACTFGMNAQVTEYCEAKGACVGSDVQRCEAAYFDALEPTRDDAFDDRCASLLEDVVDCLVEESVCLEDAYRPTTPICDQDVVNLNNCCGAVVINTNGRIVGDLRACLAD